MGETAQTLIYRHTIRKNQWLESGVCSRFSATSRLRRIQISAKNEKALHHDLGIDTLSVSIRIRTLERAAKLSR